MRQVISDLIGRLKQALRPHVVGWLGRLPPTARYSGKGHILMFHRVVPPEEISPLGMAAFEITPQRLEMTIGFFLKRGYKVLSLDEMCSSLTSDAESEKFIVLTFDDGYKDTLTHAYPILQAYDAPFTLNITWNYAERAALKWDYLAEDLIQSHDTIVIDSSRGSVELDCSTWDRKRQSCSTLQNILYGMNDAESNAEMKAFFGAYLMDIFAKTDELMLDWAQIEELARNRLVTIGAHSVNHYILRRLSDSIAKDEISRSKTRLESRLGMEVSHFTYPYGGLHESGEREFEIVKHCGFKTGSTGMKGNIFQDHAHRLRSLPRFCLGSNCTPQHLSAIANGSLPFIANGFRRSPL